MIVKQDHVTRAFAPRLAGGAILNVISALSWYTFTPASNGYAASKAAEWSLTNGTRLELADQKTQVTDLVELAAQAHAPTNAILKAADREELKTYENQSRDTVGSFITAASAQILERTDR